MTAIRITCLLAVMVLGVAGLNWVAQYGSAPGAVAPAVADRTVRQDTRRTAPKDTKSDGRKPLELTKGLDGFRMPCKDCHKGLGPASKDPVRGAGPHKEVVLKHGHNNRCFNCHYPSSDQYGSFVDHDGSVIPFEHVERLCAKCHGPHYRAWKQGAHGQRTGYWDLNLGTQTTARCNACHDPHHPYFKPISTLPGPRSLQGEHPPDHPCRKEH